MRKPGYFFRSIPPFIVMIALQIGVSMLLYILPSAGSISSADGISSSLDSLSDTASDTALIQGIQLIYGLIALLIFGLWYKRALSGPFSKKKRVFPRSFSFHTIVALVCLAIGLQYVCSLVVATAAAIRPEWLSAYESLMDLSGYNDLTPALIIYTIALAPIVEELVFRGLVYRFARCALPFIFANMYQALLFGILHMNMLQGIYAFVMGLFLGWVASRGRGVKYSVVLHILFNVIGCFYSGLISLTAAWGALLFCCIGIALTIFGMWLFFTDFTTESSSKSRSK